MTPEEFIIYHITKNIESKESIKNRIIGNALLRYRRSEFDCIEKLIVEARRQLLLQNSLDTGITTRQFSELNKISKTTAYYILKAESTSRHKNDKREWVYCK